MKIHFLASKFLKPLSYILVLVIGITSCDCSSNQQVSQPEERRASETDQITATRDFLEKEREAIQSYIEDRDLDVERTGTGMYYEILKDSSAEKAVDHGDIVEFEYEVFLMNGRLLYSSSESGNRELRIEKEDAEIGIHEALKILGLGDKGLFILPSHLAFGVAGDQHKVPPMTPLVYELKVVNIQKS